MTKRWWRGFSLALSLGAVIALEFNQANWLQRFDEGMRDFFVRMQISEEPETRLALIDIDEQSLQEIGPWPWSRKVVADLIETLVLDHGVEKIALDIVFSNSGDAEGDARLAVLLGNLPITKAEVLAYSSEPSYRLEEGDLSPGHSTIHSITEQKRNQYLEAFGYIANHATFSKGACAGNVGFTPDPDGILRRLPTLTIYKTNGYLSLSDAMLRCSAETSKKEVATSLIDYYSSKTWRIPFNHSQNSYMVISATDLLNKRIPSGLANGRHVIIGSSSLSLGDRVSTPLSPLTSGLMVHAAQTSGLLDLKTGKISLPVDGTPIGLAFICAFCLIATLVVARFGAIVCTAYLMSIMLLWVGIAYQLIQWQYEFSIVGPLVGVLVLITTLGPIEWWLEHEQMQKLRFTLGRYVAKPVLEAITQSSKLNVLAPKICDVTVLVVDMAEFTRTTSSISLDELVDLTKKFLNCVTQPVLAKEGTLDKYTGDGLMAFWGAPLPCENSVDMSIDAALQIFKDFERLNQDREVEGKTPIRMRIGIEYGKAVVGELGTNFRTTYTAIGECVNYASRIEAAATSFGVPFLIGPNAAARSVRHKLFSVGRLPIKGTGDEIEVFTCAIA